MGRAMEATQKTCDVKITANSLTALCLNFTQKKKKKRKKERKKERKKKSKKAFSKERVSKHSSGDESQTGEPRR